jgi:hypothetical protein
MRFKLRRRNACLPSVGTLRQHTQEVGCPDLHPTDLAVRPKKWGLAQVNHAVIVFAGERLYQESWELLFCRFVLVDNDFWILRLVRWTYEQRLGYDPNNC